MSRTAGLAGRPPRFSQDAGPHRRLDVSRRADWPELMDTEACDFATFRDCLTDLALVNRLTLAHGPTLRWLDGLRRSGKLESRRSLAIVDVGSGQGDLLRVIAAWAERHRLDVSLTGVDLNPWSAKAAAQAWTSSMVPVRWTTCNVFEFGGPADVVVSSLFTHHLDDDQLVAFLRWMEARAQIGWFVNDLHRHALPYHLFGWAARRLRMHRFVQHDGPVSIARAFRVQDWSRLLTLAHVDSSQVQIRWRFPFRICVAKLIRTELEG